MKEILIINLTRMGDLLQTTPLMAGFKEKDPDTRITLLVSSRFTEICKGIPYIDDLIVFDMHGFRDRLLQNKYSLVENYGFLKGLINRINEKEYDLAMNLTHSPISAFIASLVPVKELRGFTVDSEGHRVIRHPWLRYFFNVVPNRDYNPFHLVDIYLKAGNVTPQRKGLIFEAEEKDMIRAEELLAGEGVGKGETLFGIHLGASKSEKTWPVASFAALADRVSREYHARILLFGSPSEVELGKQFEITADCRPVNFIGKTGIGELSALLGKCEMLVSNDTGPLHLATSAGTRVLDIFTANVHFLETGPYGEGHYVIQADIPCVPCAFDVQCNNMICKDVITPGLVFELIKVIMDGGPAASGHNSLLWDHVQVYRTRFREDGLLGFYPVMKKPVKKEILYRILYREIWDGGRGTTDRKNDAAFGNVSEELSSYYTLDDAGEVISSLKKDLKALEGLTGLAGNGSDLINRIAEEARLTELNISRLKELSAELESVDAEIETAGHANPCLRPLTVVFAFSREALEGSGLSALTEGSVSIYGELLYRASSLLHLLKKAIAFMESKTGLKEELKPATIHETACRTSYGEYHV